MVYGGRRSICLRQLVSLCADARCDVAKVNSSRWMATYSFAHTFLIQLRFYSRALFTYHKECIPSLDVRLSVNRLTGCSRTFQNNYHRWFPIAYIVWVYIVIELCVVWSVRHSLQSLPFSSKRCASRLRYCDMFPWYLNLLAFGCVPLMNQVQSVRRKWIHSCSAPSNAWPLHVVLCIR